MLEVEAYAEAEFQRNTVAAPLQIVGEGSVDLEDNSEDQEDGDIQAHTEHHSIIEIVSLNLEGERDSKIKRYHGGGQPTTGPE